MIDVIVTISESTPRSFVNECLSTVRVAALRSAVQVDVIEVAGVSGHIGQAMLNGLARSTADYVAWVDDDDFLLPSAFSCLERHLPARPAAICAREIHLLANGRLIPVDRRHHLTAYRRDAIELVPLQDYPATPNVALLKHVDAEAVDELSWVYVYRRRLSAASALRAKAA